MCFYIDVLHKNIHFRYRRHRTYHFDLETNTDEASKEDSSIEAIKLVGQKVMIDVKDSNSDKESTTASANEDTN